MRRQKPEAFTLMWGALGPLSLLFGGSVLYLCRPDASGYRSYDADTGHNRRNRSYRPPIRRTHLRRRMTYR